jgi:hypothetical protein
LVRLENTLSNAIFYIRKTEPDIRLFCQHVIRPKFNSFNNNSSVHSPTGAGIPYASYGTVPQNAVIIRLLAQCVVDGGRSGKSFSSTLIVGWNCWSETVSNTNDRFDVVVCVYLQSFAHPAVLKLRPKLLQELKPGTRVVSNTFDMGDWRPDKEPLRQRL